MIKDPTKEWSFRLIPSCKSEFWTSWIKCWARNDPKSPITKHK